MITLIKALQVILALSILIIIHEAGHFTFAKLFGIRVEKFYLFFDIGGKSLLKFRIGETEFGIGWLPFGGYCKISGMIDESLDTESLKNEPREWEFRSHSAWHRLLVMAGGVLYNFLFAIIAYCCIMGIWGNAYIDNSEASIIASPLARDLGFRDGDRILRMDDYVPEDFAMLQADLARRDVRRTDVLRDGDTVSLYMDQSRLGDIINCPGMFDLAIPFVIDSMTSLNSSSGIIRSDRIIAFGGKDIRYLQDARSVLETMRDSIVTATVVRGSDTLLCKVNVDTSGRIGAMVQTPGVKVRKYNFAESIPAGIKLTGSTISGYLKDLKLLVEPSTGAYKSVGSFIAIGQVFPSSWDWYRFLNILALLSIMLGVMNLIPIPGLDGGHILFVLYEIISGHKPSDKFLIVAQYLGMFLLILLMLLAFGNDIGRLIR